MMANIKLVRMFIAHMLGMLIVRVMWYYLNQRILISFEAALYTSPTATSRAMNDAAMVFYLYLLAEVVIALSLLSNMVPFLPKREKWYHHIIDIDLLSESYRSVWILDALCICWKVDGGYDEVSVIWEPAWWTWEVKLDE